MPTARKLPKLISALLLLCACAAEAGAPAPSIAVSSEAALDSRTVVSLTFDDGLADQYQAGAMLAARGMRGTFYVNSGRTGQSGSLTLSQLNALARAGHEIAGHTINHVNLTTVGEDEARRQVCGDRRMLLERGFAVTSFAYPFDGYTPDLESLLIDCGYNSGRGVGGIRSGSSCAGCRLAESWPLDEPYHIRTPASIKADTSLAAMQSYVTQAEAGGGWVVLVFHHVCDGCAENGVPPQRLAAFLDWLATRARRGTVVRTVEDVMDGALQPPPESSPPPPPPPPSGQNLLKNPSLETDADRNGVPDCWQRAGFGDNTFIWSAASDAYDGSRAESVHITRLVTGARRLVSQQDSGACAPVGMAGHRYRTGAHYRSTAPVRFTAYYRNDGGSWVWWAQSGMLPASAGYTAAVWTTPALPAEGRALSVGLTLYEVGQVAMDGHELIDLGAP